MNNIVFLLFLLCSVNAFCSEVKVDVSVQVGPAENRRSEITLIADIVNGSKKTILLSELSDHLINCEIELWFLGKGVKLRPKIDADWRRAQAFILWTVKALKTGEKRRCIFKLKELIPDDPDNDDFAKSLIYDVEHFKSGKGRVVIEFVNKDVYDDKNSESIVKYNIAQGAFDVEESIKKESVKQSAIQGN